MSWHDLSPAEQDVLDRIWRGAAASAEEASVLVEAGFAVLDDGRLRLTDQGECLMLARLPALKRPKRASRARRGAAGV